MREDEFTEVYQSTFRAVWRYAAGHGIRDADLEDVVQETFVIVARRLGEFEARSSVKTWVIGIAVNVVRSFRRRVATRALGMGYDGDTLAEFHGIGGSVAEARAELLRLERLLLELPEHQREAFVLCDVEGWSAVEAAQALEVNENTLRTRLRAARLHVNEKSQKV